MSSLIYFPCDLALSQLGHPFFHQIKLGFEESLEISELFGDFLYGLCGGLEAVFDWFCCGGGRVGGWVFYFMVSGFHSLGFVKDGFGS